jgi:hypothetical protein
LTLNQRVEGSSPSGGISLRYAVWDRSAATPRQSKPAAARLAARDDMC